MKRNLYLFEFDVILFESSHIRFLIQIWSTLFELYTITISAITITYYHDVIDKNSANKITNFFTIRQISLHTPSLTRRPSYYWQIFTYPSSTLQFY